MNTDIKLAVAYARVSTRDQERTGHTLTIQSKNMLEYSERMGIKIVKEFVVAESASKKDRRHYQEMWDFLGKHTEIKHIIFEEIDRFTRNDKDKLGLLDLVNNEGYVAHFVSEKLKLDMETSPNDIFLFDILVAKAKNYSLALSQKVKKGQQGKLEKGGFPGGYPPFGYKKINSDLVPFEPYASCTKKAFEYMEREHLTLVLLAKRLNKMGFRTLAGKKISKTFMHNILTSPIYCGTILWNGKTYNGKHEALVPKRRFKRVVDWLGRKNFIHGIKHNFTYRGFMKCGECGCTITAETHKGHIYYRCTGYYECKQRKYTREEEVEKRITEVLNKLYLGKRAAQIIEKKILEKREEETGFKQMRVEDLKKEYQRIIDWIDKLYDDKLSGLIDEEMYKRKCQEYTRRKEEISENLEDYANGNCDSFELSCNILELINRASDIYKRRSPDEKRLLLNILLSNAILKEGKVDLTLRTPFDHITEYAKSGNWSGTEDLNL